LLASKGRSVAVAESTYLANLEKSGKIEVKRDAPATVRAIANDPDAYRRNNTVLATSAAGNFTAARMIGWLETLPPNARIIDQIKQAPDSALLPMVKRFATNELVLKQADSAKITIDPAEIAQLHASFVNAVKQVWGQLGISPASLQDSAKSDGDREKLAAKRIDVYFDKLVQEAAAFVAVPTPVANALRSKYSYSFNDSGFDRAVEQASKIRNSADSARSAGQPATAVPLSPAPPPAASSTPPAGKK
jgi:peptidyl-prolyl cis-trans isomerase D